MERGIVVFYDEFKRRCITIGKSPTAVAAEIGIGAASVSDWKKKGYTPSARTLKRIADYFGVTPLEMLGEKNNPAPNRDEVDAETAALFNSLTPEQQEQARAFLRFLSAGADSQEK